MDALAKDREALAAEAAANRPAGSRGPTTTRAIATYESEIAVLRKVLNTSGNRLRDIQRGQRIRGTAPEQATNCLADAEATLSRLQERDRLAAAGCGAPLGPDAAWVQQRFRAKKLRLEVNRNAQQPNHQNYDMSDLTVKPACAWNMVSFAKFVIART